MVSKGDEVVVGPWDVDYGPEDDERPVVRKSAPRDRLNYNPNDFYVRSTNRHDHSENARLKLPQETLAEAAALIASKAIPEYRTMSDLMRDALIHRLHWIANELDDAELKQWVKLEINQAKAEKQERQAEFCANLVKTWADRLARANADHDAMGIKWAKEAMKEALDDLREPWLSQMQELINRRM